ncbi:MAG: hypothetical protein R3202_10985, partial [Candidatus Competibacterales bacterium]|nr:hypothetical protein [Candidatus Competibacterales bacterium]
RNAPRAVVLRRGPSAWVRLSLWHTDSDRFEHGQWFRGRVYEHRCDVSPDASLFAYFAHKAPASPELGVDSWAALSRPPWFTALALWGVGTTYFAGGFFLDARRLLLGGIRDRPDRGRLPQHLRLVATAPYLDRTPEWTERTVYINRLLRDGWRAQPTPDAARPLWEKHEPGGERRLLMTLADEFVSGVWCIRRRNEYALTHRSDLQPLGHAEWADWDARGRLLLARAGRLWSIDPAGCLNLIEDFRAQQPDPQPSPPRASEPP